MRKVLGGLFLFFIAAPVLGAMIWAAGIAHGVLGEGFLEEVPREVIRQLPEVVEESFEAAKQPGAIQDPDAAAWVAAAAAAHKTPSEVLDESGIYAWLEGEVDGTITEVHRSLRGEVDPRDVILDLRPLKTALTSTPMRTWVTDVLGQLPACDAAGLKRWGLASQRMGKKKLLPPCNPGVQLGAMPVQTVIDGLVEFPDQVAPLKGHKAPRGLNVLQTTDRFLWVMFIVPLILLVIGAAIASTKGGGFLGWLGIGTLFGSFGTLLTAWTTQGLVIAALAVDPSLWTTPKNTPFWTSEVSLPLGRRIADFTSMMIDRLFDPVVMTAWIVAAVGAVLVGLSLLVRDEK